MKNLQDLDPSSSTEEFEKKREFLQRRMKRFLEIVRAVLRKEITVEEGKERLKAQPDR